jgi:hypothetical protein
VTGAVLDLDRNLPTLEGIVVDPLHDVGRTIVFRLVERAVDQESDGAERRAGGGLNARDDADRARSAGPAERRGQTHRQRGVAAEAIDPNPKEDENRRGETSQSSTMACQDAKQGHEVSRVV